MKNSSTIANVAVQTDGALVHAPMRVCMHVRGVARTDGRVMREATALVAAGFDVSIVDIETDMWRTKNENVDGVHLKHIMKPTWLKAAGSKTARVLRTLQKLVTTTARLCRVPASIYHAHDINALLPCFIAATLRRKRLVFDAHEMPLYQFVGLNRKILNKLIVRFSVYMMRSAAGIITVSPPIIEEMAKRYAISDITLVRNILPYQTVPASDRLRQQLKLGPEVRIVLYQGNLQPGRGLETLVKTAKFLGKDIVIVFLGKECGTTLAELHLLIAQEGVADRIKILSPVPYEELLSWTASADIGAITYSPDFSINAYVQLPNKLFEYLMVGLPILASPLPAIADILTTHTVGRVLSSLEPSNIAFEINAMLADTVHLAQMKRNALAVARQDLCWEKERQQIINLYHRLEKTHK